jgi:hypothetical protein
MCDEMKWLYVLALKADERLGHWIGPSDTVVEFFNTRIELGRLYHFVVDNHIDFDQHGGRV